MASKNRVEEILAFAERMRFIRDSYKPENVAEFRSAYTGYYKSTVDKDYEEVADDILEAASAAGLEVPQEVDEEERAAQVSQHTWT